MNTQVSESDIIEYYDQSYDDYQIVWHLESRMSIHYGYWDQTATNLRAALTNLNRKLAVFASVQPNHRVLDAGCGVGGSAIYLAKEIGCRVTGITLSAAQAAKAKANAAKHDVSSMTDFMVGNYLSMPFEDESFDVVWCIESVCHANKKEDFMNEAFRVLKKGGTLVIADVFRTEKNPLLDASHWMQKWTEGCAIPDFEKLSLFEQKIWNAGFSEVKNLDITSHIYPTARRLFYCLIPGIICDGFLRLFGKRNKWNKANVWLTLYQYRSLQEKFWDYRFVHAVK